MSAELVSDEPRLPAWVAPAVDFAVVVVFVVIGRRTHGEDPGVRGFLHVIWPFVVGLVAGYAVTGLVRRPLEWRRAAGAGLVTVALGETLRLTVQSRPWRPGFLVVAILFIGACLLGWRTVVRWRSRRRASVTR
jgi:chromate transport protein ChrA